MILSHVKDVFEVTVTAGQLSEAIPRGSFAHLVALGCFEGNLGHVIREHIFPGALLDDCQVEHTTALAYKRVLNVLKRTIKRVTKHQADVFASCLSSALHHCFLGIS